MPKVKDLVGDKKADVLANHGIVTVEDVDNADDEALLKIEGIGKSTIDKLRGNQEVVEHKPQEAQPRTEGSDVQDLIRQGLSNGADVETMQQLFDLQKNVKEQQAREAFVEAMAQFQAEIPEIDKTKVVKNKDGSERYKYATLQDIVRSIKKPLADNGLAYSWETENTVKDEKVFVKVTCTVTHKMGHEKTSTVELPLLKSEYMNSPQAYASTQTYAKRYSLNNTLGISTGEEDTDANSVGSDDRKTGSKKAMIVTQLRRLDVNTREKTKSEVADIVKEKTGEELKPENYDEILNKLSILVTEKEEYDNSDESN